MFKRLCAGLFWLIVIPVGLGLLLVLMPFILIGVFFGEIRAKVLLRRFRKRQAGSFYLLCSRRRGWFEFVQNNVAPVLPPNVHLIWHRTDYGPEPDDVGRLLARSGVYGVSKPALIAVKKDRVQVRSLHADLVSLKATPARDEGIARQCREIIEAAISKP